MGAEKKKRNLTFTVFGAIGMILVMLGHMDYDVATIGGVFPYYSFQVLIFPFISGYFYKVEDETHIGRFIVRKAKHLLLPYFIWNILYGLIALLMRRAGFAIGEDFNLWNIFVAPFIGGHQFMYNATAWFVPALFLLEVINVCVRRLLALIHIRNEWVLFVMYLLVGCFAVFMAKRGSVYDYYKIPGRLMVMAPSLAMGRLYREKLERFDIMPSVILFPFLIIINIVLGMTHDGLAYSVVWVTGFANTVFTPYITAATGIWFWLRVSKLIARLLEGGMSTTRRFVEYMGSHTYDIMMHHLMIFMGVKAVFAAIADKCALCADFDFEAYRTDVYYTYIPDGCDGFKWVYLIIGVLGCMMIARCVDVCRDKIGKYVKTACAKSSGMSN